MDIADLKNKLKTMVDEVSFLELLDISIEELVERFEEEIIEKHEYICQQLELNDTRLDTNSSDFLDRDIDN